MTSWPIEYVLGSLPGLPGEHSIAILPEDTHISRWVKESRRLDHDQNALPKIGELIDPGDVVYDVGAFIGDHSCYYASCGATVVAFEALGDAYACLEFNAGPYGDRIIPVLASIGQGGYASINRDTFEEANKGARRLTRGREAFSLSPILRLDNFWAFNPSPSPRIPSPSLIKLDIEGWELEALHGASTLLHRVHPTLVVEVNREALGRQCTDPEELLLYLHSYGYTMRDLYTGELWFTNDPRPQFDVVCK